MSNELYYNPNGRSAYAKSINDYIRKKERRRRNASPRGVRNCVIIDSYSGEERKHGSHHTRMDRHVWWVLQLPDGTTETVRCGHDYDYIMSNIGNPESQIGRYATIQYKGLRADMKRGFARIQPDYSAKMPNPEADATTLSIGALAGIMDDDDPLGRMDLINVSSENKGPRIS